MLSPWAIGGARVLREPPGQALLTLQVQQAVRADLRRDDAGGRARARRATSSRRCDAELTGLAPLVRAINEASLDSLDQGELIALPILFVMLLLIFRSPIAALVPAISGLLVTRIGTALMGGVNEVIEVDALALNMVTMIGLALGVDYSLLIVSRFREELAAGKAVADAVEESIARAGRTVLFAGTALAVGMLGALLIAPGALLVSATMGVIVATVMAVAVALFAMPAGLAVLGTNIDRWQFGRRARRQPVGAALRARAAQAGRRRLLRAAAAAGAVGARRWRSTPGPPNVANLPPDDASRKSYEAFERDRGAGWSTPYEVVFQHRGSGHDRQAPARARALPGARRPAAGRRGRARARGAARAHRGAAPDHAPDRDRRQRRSSRLERGLRRVRAGTGELRDGLQAGRRAAPTSSSRGSGRPRTAPARSPAALERGRAADQATRGRRRADAATGAEQITREHQPARARRASGCAANMNELRDSLNEDDTTLRRPAQRPAQPGPVGGAVGAAQPRQRSRPRRPPTRRCSAPGRTFSARSPSSAR